jgi:L-threonylcarbamoyladenylate synthase
MDNTLLNQAITAVQNGNLIIYPTDTQYALGCTLSNPETIQRIYTLKQRPLTLALPIAVATINDISYVATMQPTQKKIAQTYLPGPLTMILYKKSIIPDEVTASKETIAVRIPNNPLTLSLLKETGPLIITSANIHGQKPYEDIKDILQQFGDEVAIYIPGGTLNKPPSTIIDFTKNPPTLVRKGPISLDEIINVMNK